MWRKYGSYSILDGDPLLCIGCHPGGARTSDAAGDTGRFAGRPPGGRPASYPVGEFTGSGEKEGEAAEKAPPSAPSVRQADRGVLLNERAHAEGRVAL